MIWIKVVMFSGRIGMINAMRLLFILRYMAPPNPAANSPDKSAPT